jgi:hypothetical protein
VRARTATLPLAGKSPVEQSLWMDGPAGSPIGVPCGWRTNFFKSAFRHTHCHTHAHTHTHTRSHTHTHTHTHTHADKCLSAFFSFLLINSELQTSLLRVLIYFVAATCTSCVVCAVRVFSRGSAVIGLQDVQDSCLGTLANTRVSGAVGHRP